MIHKFISLPVSRSPLLLSHKTDKQSLVPIINAAYENAQKPFRFAQFIDRHITDASFTGRYPKASDYYPFDKDEHGIQRYIDTIIDTPKGAGIVFSLVNSLPDYLNNKIRFDRNNLAKTFMDYYTLCIRENYHPDLELKWTEERGWGVAAKSFMLCGTFLGIYPGKLMYFDALQCHSKNEYLAMVPNRDMNLVIDAETHGNLTRFINHRSNEERPNLRNYWIRVSKLPYVILVTANVHSGEELFWNYGVTPPFAKK